jgi:hypothetical protein
MYHIIIYAHNIYNPTLSRIALSLAKNENERHVFGTEDTYSRISILGLKLDKTFRN